MLSSAAYRGQPELIRQLLGITRCSGGICSISSSPSHACSSAPTAAALAAVFMPTAASLSPSSTDFCGSSQIDPQPQASTSQFYLSTAQAQKVGRCFGSDDA